MSENHIHTHVDENSHTHSHQHPHEQTKAVLNRISRAQGHLEAVRKMIERGEDCAQVLVQLSAVISALNSTGRVNPGYISSMLRSHAAAKRRFCRHAGSCTLVPLSWVIAMQMMPGLLECFQILRISPS